jgi:hypothetical protein
MMKKDIQININMEDEDTKAMELCDLLEEIVHQIEDNPEWREIPNAKFSMEIIPELKRVIVSFEDFELINFKETKRNNITITTSLMKDIECRDAVIHFAIECFVENWLKYHIKEIRADYHDRKSYLEIPRGFTDPERYMNSLNGWDKESLLWKSNYNVTDELQKVGGLK